MKRHPVLSIRNIILGLGGFSILTALGLAGMGLVGLQRQLVAREGVVILERALSNHDAADAFMDDVRNDVLRSLASKLGTSTENSNVIEAELEHHIATFTAAILEDRDLPLVSNLHQKYVRLAEMLPSFAQAGRATVALALTDPAAGSARYESFRSGFSSIEEMMDGMRDELKAQVREVRAGASQTAALVKQMIAGSALISVVLLGLITIAAVKMARGITADLASSREEAQHLALHDVLTDLPNRVLLSERLNQDLALTRRQDGKLAVLCLDLDRFKQVNDTLGHHTGDALLRAVALRLRTCLRGSDTVARLGGDEFTVVQTPVRDLDEVVALAERIIEVLTRPYDLDGQNVVIGTSVGVSLAPDDTLDPDELLKMADMALYRAKGDGRGTYRLFEAEMDRKMQARRVLELDIRRAIAAGEFEVHYQPLIDVPSSKVMAFEALARWRHPERGLVPPIDFIPLAEDTGLIVPLGAWVLKRACADAANWPADVRVAVNVSATQFKGIGLVMAVTEALTSSGLLPSRLELEITETALLTDADATLTILRALRDSGVRIAMDDFGTGYSSLGYLRSFPFDKIKIDGCFVRDIETSRDCKAIVQAVTGLGTNLDITITAEGVETLAQLEMLRAAGCEQAQGYYFSRPVPAERVPELLERQWDGPSRDDVRSHRGGASALPHVA